MKKIIIAVVACVLVSAASAATTLRVGYFPNITHAQAIVARTLAAEGKGWFEQRLGPDVKIEWFAYNAGPSAMEAIFAGSLDLTYVGPNPALNAYIRSRGQEVRVVSGAARGGAALLVRPEAGITTPADFKGKRLATPQLGNTQDVAARAWLRAQGFKITQLAGEVNVLPTANPDQLALFQQGKIDAAWTVEPWVSRIEQEAGGTIFLEQKDVVTTMLVARVKALSEQRALLEKFVRAHRELTDWINAHPEEAQKLVQRGLTEEVRREIKLSLVQSSWRRLTFSNAIELQTLESLVEDARALGFIRGKVDLTSLLSIPQ